MSVLTTVYLIGFGHPESARLAEELRKGAPQLEFRDVNGQLPEQVDAPTDVALAWCPRGVDDAAALVEETVSVGLPTVALLQDSSLPPIDFNSGHVEVAFLPTSCPEVLSRIDLVAARANGPADRNVIVHGDLTIDQDRYEVTLAGKKIDLTYKEYELLKYIAARPGRVFSRESLLRAVWDYDYFGGTRTVDVHVRRLRSKINDVRYQFIETVWNVGYRFRGA